MKQERAFPKDIHWAELVKRNVRKKTELGIGMPDWERRWISTWSWFFGTLVITRSITESSLGRKGSTRVTLFKR